MSIPVRQRNRNFCDVRHSGVSDRVSNCPDNTRRKIMSRYLASDIDQSTRAKDELKDDELGQISGGDGVVNHSEFSFVKLLDVSTPKIYYK
jgi:hypothetical protein